MNVAPGVRIHKCKRFKAPIFKKHKFRTILCLSGVEVRNIQNYKSSTRLGKAQKMIGFNMAIASGTKFKNANLW